MKFLYRQQGLNINKRTLSFVISEGGNRGVLNTYILSIIILISYFTKG